MNTTQKQTPANKSDLKAADVKGNATTQKTAVPKDERAPSLVLDDPGLNLAAYRKAGALQAISFFEEDLAKMQAEAGTRPLSKKEMDELEAHEETLRQGLPAFLAVAMALYDIQSKKLWRMYCKSFAEYCDKRLKISRTFAYMQAQAAGAMHNLSTSGEQMVLPSSERQLRPLATLEPKIQIAAWKLALEKAGDGKVTGKQVEEAVKEVQGEESPQKNWLTKTRGKLVEAGYEADFMQPVEVGEKEWIDFVHEESEVYVKLIDQPTLSNLGICLAMKKQQAKCQVLVNGAAIRKSKLEMKDGRPSRLLDPILSVFLATLGALLEYEGRLFQAGKLSNDSKLELVQSEDKDAGGLRAALEPLQLTEVIEEEE